MANVKNLVGAPAVIPAPGSEGAQGPQHTESETYSKSILGPVFFTLSNLNVAGSNPEPADPAQSQYIVAANEMFTVSVDIEFNTSPLSKLLMCLGTSITVDFGFEGFGANASEADVKASIVTQKDVFKYTVSWTGTAEEIKLNSGLYEIGAVVTVGPGNNPCAQYIFGYGYIEEILLQVYPA